jgi:transposase
VNEQRRRRFSVDQKLKILEAATQPGMTVSCVARQHDISPSLIFHWRRHFANGGTGTVPISNDISGNARIQVLEARVRELERMLGKMVIENEALRQAAAAHGAQAIRRDLDGVG